MKNAMAITAATVILISMFSIAAYALYETGWGTSGTATTTPKVAQNFTANAVSIYNDGTNRIFALVNISSNEFVTRLTNGTAIIIPAGASWTFNAQNETSISKVWYATTNGTSPFVLGAY